MLRSTAAFFKTPETLENELFLAVQNGQLDEVKEKLSANKININCVNDGGYTPLHIAAEHGHVALCAWLLDHGAYINAPNKEGGVTRGYIACCAEGPMPKKTKATEAKESGVGQTPLHLAVTCDHLDVARLLLERGARVDVVDILFRTPIYFAVSLGYAEMVALLIQHKANIQAPAGRTGCSLLYLAVDEEDLEIVKLLVENGADINDTRGNYDARETALHLAIEQKNKDIIEYLLEKGADTAVENSKKQTPLQLTEHQSYADLLYDGFKDLIERYGFR